MNRCLGLAIATFLTTLAVPLAANALTTWDDNENVQWQGPGYYVADAVTAGACYINRQKGVYPDICRNTLYFAGPFSSKADCDAAVSAHAGPDAVDDDGHACMYIATESDF